MSRPSAHAALIAVLLVALVVPTSAAGGDRVWEDEGIVLSPHGGPNGRYAHIGGDGNLTIDMDGEAVSANAVTVVDDVFDVRNDGTEHKRVWVTHAAPDRVQFRDGSGSIQGQSNGTVVPPGETVPIGLAIDTEGVSPGTTLLNQIEIHAREVDPPSAPGDGGSGGGGDAGDDGEEDDDDSPPGTVVNVGRVEIQLDRELRSNETVDVDRLDRLPPEPAGASVEAVIRRQAPGGGLAAVSVGPADRLAAMGADSVVTEGEPATLSSAGTLVGSASGIDRELHLVGVYEISVPDRLRETGGTLLVTVNRTRFPGGDPATARAARLTDRGWELLETRPARGNETHVVLEARTEGFSTFAVFAESDLEFRWDVDGRGPFQGPSTVVAYEEPGIYNATLTVTDAHGRSDRATHRLLVNDRPAVRIEAPERPDAGERVTLRADVANEYGRTSVEWRFPDGSTAEGTEVTRTFDGGLHVVSVTVRDEFGATGEASRRLAVGPGPVVEVVEFALGLEGRIGLVALVALATLAVLRWVQSRRGRPRRRRSR